MVLNPVKRYRGRRIALRLKKRAMLRRFARRVAKGAGINPYSVYNFKETCQLPDLTVQAKGTSAFGVGGILQFKLTDLFNSSSYANLFDMYRITGVKLKIVPRYNVSIPSGPTYDQAGLPMIYYEINHDPAVPAPTSIADVLNADGIKIKRLDKPFKIYIKNPTPNITDLSGNSLPFYFNISKNNLWLTTGGNGQPINQSSILHYGLRYWLDNSMNLATQINFNVFATYYFSMKERD